MQTKKWGVGVGKGVICKTHTVCKHQHVRRQFYCGTSTKERKRGFVKIPPFLKVVLNGILAFWRSNAIGFELCRAMDLIAFIQYYWGRGSYTITHLVTCM